MVFYSEVAITKANMKLKALCTFGVMSSQESQRSALSALLKHSWTRRSVIMSDVMMRVDQEPVLWPGHMGLQVGGQSPSSGRVTWGSSWEVRGQSPSSEVNVVYW